MGWAAPLKRARFALAARRGELRAKARRAAAAAPAPAQTSAFRATGAQFEPNTPLMDSSHPACCKTEQPPSGTLWRDGKYAVGRVDDLEFPDRCAACNAPVGARRESLTLAHRSFLFWYLSGDDDFSIFSRHPIDADWVDALVPLCGRHGARRALGPWVVAASLLVGVVEALRSAAAHANAQAGLCLAAALAGAGFGLWLRGVVGLKRKSNGQAWIKVGRRFLDSLPAAPPPSLEQDRSTARPTTSAASARSITAGVATAAYRGGGPLAWVAGNVWREDDCIVGDPDDLVLPDRCVICDAPCKGQRRNVSIHYHAAARHRWIRHVWPFHFGLRIDRFFMFAVPICKKHARRADVGPTLISASLVAAMSAAQVGVARFLVVLPLALFVAWLGYRFRDVVRVERVGSDKVWLKVGRPFLESIPRARRSS